MYISLAQVVVRGALPSVPLAALTMTPLPRNSIPGVLWLETPFSAQVEVTVAQPDVGKMIGRQGRTIQAMRTIASIAGERLGKTVTLEVRD